MARRILSGGLVCVAICVVGTAVARGAEGRAAASKTAPAADAVEPEEAARSADSAADDAWLAARAAVRREREAIRRREFRGPFAGAAFAYAAEDFNDGIVVNSSLAGAAFIGYRFAPLVAAEVRYEGFARFDLDGPAGSGEIDGFAITLNGKVYPFGGPIQPFFGVGIGAIRLENDSPYGGPIDPGETDNDVVFRFLGGVDLPITRNLIFNLEGAYLVPGDDLSDLKIGMMAAGLTFQF